MRFENIPMLAGYEVKETIADWSDKSIYWVEDEKGGQRVVKVFKRTYKYPLYENLSRLTHPNMPRIYGTFLMEDCFYVLEEWIEGRTVREILETDGAFDSQSSIDIILQLCDVLMYLHNQFPPIIHRDITPSNVMLTSDGVVKLLDFDIAREHKKEAGKDTEVFGTKPFAPPEQYGFAQSDHRTDIYSLGILMTVMLTNTYDPQRIRSSRIRAVVRRCTAFDPKRRPPDARMLKNRLRLCVSPSKLLPSMMSIDTNIYVFPHTRLHFGRLVIPIITIYLTILAMAFIQPHPPNGAVPSTSLGLFTIIINPQWTACDAQYKIFYIVIFALLFTLSAFVSFAVYDIARFYYLKAIQQYYLKRNTPRNLGTIPFVIASKRYVHCALAVISVMAIVCSIPFTDVWTTYDIHGTTILAVLICNLVSFAVRSGRYPKCYNKAVRCYYKGNGKKAVKFAKKSAGVKRNHARAWLAEILGMKDELS